MNIDFTEIPVANKGGKDQDIFELFACDFLESLGYEIIQRPSRGPDGKKDLIVQSNSVPGTTSDSKTKWLVSCKHFAHSGRGISDTDEPDISDRLTNHECHGFLGFYSTISNTTLSEKLAGMNKRFVSTIYDHSRIEKEIHSLKDKERILATYFPKSREKWDLKTEQKKEHSNKENTKDFNQCKFDYKKQLEISRTAQIQIEIAKLTFSFSNKWEKNGMILDDLYAFVDFSNEIIAKDIFDFLHFRISSRARSNMPSSIASSIHSLILTYFPSSYDREDEALRIENGKQCVYTAFNIIYDAFIYTNNYGAARWGLSIWKYIYRESKGKEYEDLIILILNQYNRLEEALNRPERNDLDYAKEMVLIFKNDLDTYDLSFPIMSDTLFNFIENNDF